MGGSGFDKLIFYFQRDPHFQGSCLEVFGPLDSSSPSILWRMETKDPVMATVTYSMKVWDVFIITFILRTRNRYECIATFLPHSKGQVLEGSSQTASSL